MISIYFLFVIFLIIDIFITEEGNILTATVTPSFTIQELKDIVTNYLQLVYQERYPGRRFMSDDFRFHYQDTKLKDDNTLSSYNITDDAHLEVKCR